MQAETIRKLVHCGKCGGHWCPDDGFCKGCKWRSDNYLYVEEDTGLCTDDGLWRSYTLIAEGATLAELMESAGIVEVDQDGGSDGAEPLCDYRREVIETCERIIARAFLKSREGQGRGEL